MKYFLFIFCFLVGVNLQATLTSDLFSLHRAKLPADHAISKVCPIGFSSNSACDDLIYKSAILFSYFDWMKTKTTDMDMSLFEDSYKRPNAVCLRDGFWKCMYFSLLSSIEHTEHVIQTCRADKQESEELLKRQRDSLKLLEKACELDQKSSCFSELGGKASNHSGYRFEQMPDYFILQSSCEQDLRREEKLRTMIEYFKKPSPNGDACETKSSEKMDPLVYRAMTIADLSLEKAALSESEIKEALIEVVDEKEKNNQLNEKQKQLIKNTKGNKKYISKMVKHYASKKSKNRNIEVQYLEIQKDFSRALDLELTKLDEVKGLKIKKVKKDLTDLSPADSAESDFKKNVKDPNFEEVKSDMKKVLQGNDELSWGELLIAHEHLQRNSSFQSFQDALWEWEKLKQKSELLWNSTEGQPQFYRLEVLFKELNSEYLSHYEMKKNSLTDLLLGKTGNCDSQTRMALALLHDIKIKNAQSLKLGVEVFTDHVQPVLYYGAPATTNLVNFSAAPQRGDIYDPKIMFDAALKQLKEISSKDSGLLIAKAPEREKVKGSPSKIEGIETVDLIYPRGLESFYQNGEVAPKQATITFAPSSSLELKLPVQNHEKLPVKKNSVIEKMKGDEDFIYLRNLKPTKWFLEVQEKDFLEEVDKLHKAINAVSTYTRFISEEHSDINANNEFVEMTNRVQGLLVEIGTNPQNLKSVLKKTDAERFQALFVAFDSLDEIRMLREPKAYRLKDIFYRESEKIILDEAEFGVNGKVKSLRKKRSKRKNDDAATFDSDEKPTSIVKSRPNSSIDASPILKTNLGKEALEYYGFLKVLHNNGSDLKCDLGYVELPSGDCVIVTEGNDGRVSTYKWGKISDGILQKSPFKRLTPNVVETLNFYFKNKSINDLVLFEDYSTLQNQLLDLLEKHIPIAAYHRPANQKTEKGPFGYDLPADLAELSKTLIKKIIDLENAGGPEVPPELKHRSR